MPLDATALDITLPANGWRPRHYQRALWRYLENGGTRACAIFHRRSGKDEIALHWTAIAAHMRVGNYWHMLPEASQARKAIWAAVNPHTGKRRINEAFPMELRAQTLENEMFIRFKNGSTWQVVGSDRFDSLVGSAPIGIVFSEWAISHPAALAYLSPILRENKGWSLFITTPRGRNHAFRMYEDYAATDGYFAQRLDAEQTQVFTAAELEEERRSLIAQYGDDMGSALYSQEYMVSWDAAILGSYWGAELAKAEREGRIGSVSVDPTLPVHTGWDIGRRDSTAIWFFQTDGRRLRFVDYYENHTVDAEHYAKEVLSRGYLQGTAWLPHDGRVIEWTAKRTRAETLVSYGLNAQIIPDHRLMDGINSVRQALDRCEFDAQRCSQGLAALKAYQKEWNEKMQRFSDDPLHNWASHGADAFRSAVVGWAEDALPKPRKPAPTLAVGRANKARLNDLGGDWRQRL